MNNPPRSNRKPTSLPRMPDTTIPERIEEVARAAAGALVGTAVPVLGDALSEFLGGFFPSIRMRRADAWLNDLRTAINDLAKRSVRVEDLKNDDAFHDIVCAATEAAIRTHLDEKRLKLRNAIVNSALPGAPALARQHMFVQLVEDLQEMHLHLLDLLANPAAFLEGHGMAFPVHEGPTGMGYDPATSNASLQAITLCAFDAYRNEPELLDVVLADLNRRGLVDTTTLVVQCPRGKSFASRLGLEFLRFTREPAPPGK